MKKFFLIILSIFLQILAMDTYAQNTLKSKREKEFLKTCDAIAQAYLKRDVKKINSFIHSKTGVYLLYRPSMLTADLHLDTLTLDYSIDYDNKMIADCYPKDLEFYFPHPDSQQVIKPVKFYSKLKYDCFSGWNKYGAFADSVHMPSRLSRSVKGLIEEYTNYLPEYKEEIKEFKSNLKRVKALEKNSREVVYNQFKNKDLIFYLTWINNKWHLTFFDFVAPCEVY